MRSGRGENRDTGGGSNHATPMHVVMLPWLAFGHIVPFAQLARRLLASSSTSVRVTFLTAAGNVPRVEAMLLPPTWTGAEGAVVIVPLRLPRVPGLPEARARGAEMEGAYVDYLAAQFRKPVLAVGPLVPDPPRGDVDDRWATWLSSFPDSAVVFASFGSETFLPPNAAMELLLGLEATGRPFLAVLNSPDATNAVVLPPGFAERVAGRGVVCSGWVQQQHILRHRSVGCYVTHAGFSSVIEGLVAGCRLVLLPMKGDQFLNAALFAREVRVGIEVARRDEDGWFGRQDLCDAVVAAMADGGDVDTRKWANFLMDDGVQGRFADEFIRQLTELVSAASS